MDTRSWRTSANRYYAFEGEEHEVFHRISKTPPPASTHSSRSPLPATYAQKSAPTPPMHGSSPLPTSSLLARISPKGHSPNSKPTRELPPLSPELGDYHESHLGEEEEEEEQVIRVLDNNHELVYQRDFGTDERQDRDGDPHEPRNPSPAKKRKLDHPNQPAGPSSPIQNKSKLMTRSRSRSPPIPQSFDSPSPENQSLAPRAGVDWRSGSSMKGGSQFGKLSDLTFGFGTHGYDASTEVNTPGKTTSRDRMEPAPVLEHSRGDLHIDKEKSRRLEAQAGTHEPTPPSTTILTGGRGRETREPSREGGGMSNGGTSLHHRTGSNGPISDPELEVPLEGGEDHDPGHEASHEGRNIIECDASTSIAPSLIPPSHSGDIPMDSPPPPRKSPQTAARKELPKDIAPSASVTPSRKFTSSSRAEGADQDIKTIEQHAEDLLRDIHKEYLSRTEAQAAFPPAELEGIIPGLPGGASISPRDHNEHPRTFPTPILDGISPVVGTRSISPILGIHLRCLTPEAMSNSAHTPKSSPKNLPSSIARSMSDLDSNDTLLEVDPQLDQITKQALGDLIVHNLILSHNLDANDAVRRAIKLEVDEHARDFLRLATKLARRMDLMGEPLESTVKVRDVEPNQLLVEPILSDTAENGYLEYLPPIEGSEDNEEPRPPKEDIQRVASDVEMDPVPPEVSRSDSADRVKAESNDDPAGEQEPDIEPTDEHVDRVDDVEWVDEDVSQESGLDIPGVWCVRTGKDRTDTIQEHVEVSKLLAARVKKWVRKTGTSKE